MPEREPTGVDINVYFSTVDHHWNVTACLTFTDDKGFVYTDTTKTLWTLSNVTGVPDDSDDDSWYDYPEDVPEWLYEILKETGKLTENMIGTTV